jgi:hypothetical protein
MGEDAAAVFHGGRNWVKRMLYKLGFELAEAGLDGAEVCLMDGSL